MAKNRLRDVVILIPGIMGSVLARGGVDLWSVTLGAACRGLWRRQEFIERLSVTRQEQDEEQTGDAVQATRLLQIPSLIPRLVKADGYKAIRAMMEATFSVREGSSGSPGNYYEFPYDWRLDNRIAAQRLRQLVGRILPAWREYTGDREAKVIIIGHSMGGLVGRYFTEVLDGWRDCRALITLGTPHRGSLSAIDTLSNGISFRGLSWVTPVVRTYPSVYQLLPIYKILDEGQGRRCVGESTGLTGIDEKMAASALNFHREIQAAAVRNRTEPEYQSSHLLIPFVGTDQPTLQHVTHESGRLVMSGESPDWLDPLLGGGDGTVPRFSAIPIDLERASNPHFVAEKHGFLQSNSSVLHELSNILKHMTARGWDALRGPRVAHQIPDAAISLAVDPVQIAGSPIEVRAWLRNYSSRLEGTITAVEPEGGMIRDLFTEGDPTSSWRIEGLSPGIYRVRVQAFKGGQGAPTPVNDLFAVIREEEA